jgi:hypothetical protein
MAGRTIDPFGLFVPDTIVPAQFHRRSTLHMGEVRLMHAVFEDALDCLRRTPAVVPARTPTGRPSHAQSRRSIRQETIAWFESTDRSRVYAFENICDVLGFDADAIRQALHRGHYQPRREVSLRKRGTYARPSVAAVESLRSHREPERTRFVARGVA